MTSTALDNGLAERFHSELWLLKIVWPTGTMRLMTSPGELVFGGETYLGADPAGWGTILDAEGIGDGVGGQALACRVRLALTSTLRTACFHATAQGSRADVWRGLRSLTSNEVIDLEPLIVAGKVSSAPMRFGIDEETAEVLIADDSRFLPTGGIFYDTNTDARIDASDAFNQFGAGSSVVGPAWGLGTNGGGGISFPFGGSGGDQFTDGFVNLF